MDGQAEPLSRVPWASVFSFVKWGWEQCPAQSGKLMRVGSRVVLKGILARRARKFHMLP
jgi:hypothetical protein